MHVVSSNSAKIILEMLKRQTVTSRTAHTKKKWPSYVIYHIINKSSISSIPCKLRKCAAPPDHMHSEIPFSHTCNIPMSCRVYRIDLLLLKTFH